MTLLQRAHISADGSAVLQPILPPLAELIACAAAMHLSLEQRVFLTKLAELTVASIFLAPTELLPASAALLQLVCKAPFRLRVPLGAVLGAVLGADSCTDVGSSSCMKSC